MRNLYPRCHFVSTHWTWGSRRKTDFRPGTIVFSNPARNASEVTALVLLGYIIERQETVKGIHFQQSKMALGSILSGPDSLVEERRITKEDENSTN